MTKIYIVRHGQTESNVRSTCLGHKDVPLNSEGEEQARKLAERLYGIKFDAVYTSPLSRAVNTVMPFVNMNKGMSLTMNYGLIERDFGLWDDMTFEEIQGKYPDEYRKWRDNWYTYRPIEGESIEDVQKRAGAVMDKIVKSHDGDTILIMTHLGISRTIIAHLLGLEPSDSGGFWLDNAGIATVEYKDGKGILTGLNI